MPWLHLWTQVVNSAELAVQHQKKSERKWKISPTWMQWEHWCTSPSVHDWTLHMPLESSRNSTIILDRHIGRWSNMSSITLKEQYIWNWLTMSTSGYAVKIGMGAVNWLSKKQATIVLSSMESEYIASVAARKEILWMRTFLGELQYKVDSLSPMIKSTLAVVKNPELHGRMKHLHINYHWIHQVIRGKQILPSYVPTKQMTANIFTKVLPCSLLEWHCQELGVIWATSNIRLRGCVKGIWEPMSFNAKCAGCMQTYISILEWW